MIVSAIGFIITFMASTGCPLFVTGSNAGLIGAGHNAGLPCDRVTQVDMFLFAVQKKKYIRIG